MLTQNVLCVGVPPLMSTDQISQFPVRSDMKATRLPSGENVGCMFLPGDATSGVRFEPFALMI